MVLLKHYTTYGFCTENEEEAPWRKLNFSENDRSSDGGAKVRRRPQPGSAASSERVRELRKSWGFRLCARVER